MLKRIDTIKSLSPEMIKVATLANTLIKAFNLPFAIFETKRSLERQKELVAKGYSKTLKSKHLTGDAMDIVLRIPDWSWNYDKHLKETYALAFMIQSYSEKIFRYKVAWGGDWRSFNDRAHFQWERKIDK